MQCIIMEKHSIQINTPWWNKEKGTNPPIKALRQSRHRVWGLTHRRAIKEETIAINRDWVLN